jgi:raffinose synthase
VPFWLRPVAGRTEAEVNPETLWFLAETTTDSPAEASPRYLLIIPLLSAKTRHALRGSARGLVVTSETGDPTVPCDSAEALYIAIGADPYALLEDSAGVVARHLNSQGLPTRLRIQKSIPDFIDDFGWCTWDAFYHDVSPEKLLAGLSGFSAGGVAPAFLILDDGWQTWKRMPSGEERLVSLKPNERFGSDLTSLVSEVRERFGVRRFLVWHTLLGYTGGLCEQALPGYGVRTVPRSFGPGILCQDATWNTGWQGAQIGVPEASGAARFYDDLHALLAAQGVDGVKVDYQGMLEGVSAGQGGRVQLDQAFRAALEASVGRHFSGRMINCMSNHTECVYGSEHAAVMRTSDDFFPNKPESHGLHLHTNAQASLWFGEFMQPDWDMFQSAHPRGAFHAAARALSGGPVYVSDKIEQHDFQLLQKLVLSDGSVLRADLPARPSPESIFADPTREPVPLKVFNLNRDCGVLGIFNARHDPGADPAQTLACTVSPADIPPLSGDDFVGYAHRKGTLWSAKPNTPTRFDLADGEWEIVSYAPVENGFAALGLADKFNSTGAIVSRSWPSCNEVRLRIRDGGRFLVWSERVPSSVLHNGNVMAPSRTEHPRYEYTLPEVGPGELVMIWGIQSVLKLSQSSD